MCLLYRYLSICQEENTLSFMIGYFDFQQVPLVAIQVLKYNHCSIRFISRLLQKADSVHLHRFIIAPEIVRVEKQEDAPAGLISNMGFLLGCHCLRQQQTCLTETGWGYRYPAFASAHVCILDQPETKFFSVERDCLIVIAHKQGNCTDGLFHGLITTARGVLRQTRSDHGSRAVCRRQGSRARYNVRTSDGLR